MKVVIFGGTGFVGLNLAGTLLSRGHHITLYDRTQLPALRDGYNSTNLRRTRAACTRDNDKRIWPWKAGVNRYVRDDKWRRRLWMSASGAELAFGRQSLFRVHK